MGRKLAAGLICSCCVLFSPCADADAGSPYAGLTFGKAYLNDSGIKGSDADIDYDDGEGYCYAHGLEFGNVRIEGELGYQKNDFARLESGALPEEAENGDLSILSLLGNAYYTFGSLDNRVMPIVSAGVGVASIDIEMKPPTSMTVTLCLPARSGRGLVSGYPIP
ncbi:outer membrane protein [Prosthecochloris sp. ZM_2]|uniref:outer membrane protein n=1 Tax=Prosthecochloris sp. ZM_2 TaxID=2045206 RepID=UPI001F16D4D6|nr:outer membrane beta-barrel protein [Prosthecochloris sp. ZM_2]